MSTLSFQLIKYSLIVLMTIHIQHVQAQTDKFLKVVTNQVIIPGFEQTLKDVRELNSHAIDFCKAPDVNRLTKLQQRWRVAMNSWAGVTLFKFGPMIDDNMDLKIHYFPIRKNQIKQFSISDNTMGETLPVSARGLASVEYLIFSKESDDIQLLTTFIDNSNLCHYLQIMTAQLVLDNQVILQGWKNHYAMQFNGQNETITQQEALSLLIGSIIRQLEATIKNRLGRPGGINLKQPLPYKSESWRSGESINNMIASVTQFEKLLRVNDGLVDFLKLNGNDKLAEDLIQQSKQLKDALKAIKPNLFTAVNNTHDSVLDSYRQYLMLTESVKHAASSLNIQIGFNDEDGD